MKKIIEYGWRLCLMVFLLSASTTTVHASHGAAMQLTYTALGNNQYAFTLHFYRDACGVAPSSTIALHRGGCAAGPDIIMTAGTPISTHTLCQSLESQTCCNGGSISCFREYIYTGTAYLPSCDDCIISYSECCRSFNLVNIVNTGADNIYVNTIINTLDAPNSNSVSFNNVPLVYACANIPFTYSPAAFDADGDSLVFSSTYVSTDFNSYIGWAGSYSSTNPLGGSAFSLDSTTGIIQATPNSTGNHILSIKVEEYRNGILVGTSLHDVQIVVLSNCGLQLPSPVFPESSNESIDGQAANSSALTDDYIVCAGSTLSFDFAASSVTDITYRTNLNATAMSGATLSVVGNNTHAIAGQFTWPTTGITPGIYSFNIAIEDDACPVHHVTTRVFRVKVKGLATSANQLTICTGAPNNVQLGVSSTDGSPLTGNISWTPAGVLDDASLANPTATISQPTVFTVNYNEAHCQLTKDISISASPYSVTIPDIADEILCSSNSVVLNPNGVGASGPAVYTYNTPTLIPRAIGGVSTFTDIPFNVSGIYPNAISSLSELNVINSINFTISQQLVDHLVISLVAPSGQVLVLSQNNGGAGNGYVNASFAYPVPGTALAISNYNNIPIPSNGSFTPQNGANGWQSLIGATINGTWRLRIEHNGTSNTYDGTLQNATLRINHLQTINYSWSPSAGLNDSNIASPTASPTATTSYQVLASNGLGCTNVMDVTVYVQNNLPTPTFSTQASVQYPLVFDWSSVAGAASYELSLDGGNTFFSNGTALTYTPSGFNTGDSITLCVRAQPAAGSSCSPSALNCQTLVLGPCTGLSTVISGDRLLCPNTTTTLTATPSLGAAPYTFLWSNGQTTNQITGITTGTYTLSVTDNNGCSSRDTLIISASPALSSTITGYDLHCFSDSSGIVFVSPVGGVFPHSYLWSNGATTSIIGNLAVGNYVVTITDANQCTTANQATLTQPTLLYAEATPTPVVCSQYQSGAITLSTLFGGVPPLSYYWSNGMTTPNITNLVVGNYSLIITDANLCAFTLTAAVNQSTPLALTGQTTDNESPLYIGTATVLATNGYAPYTYNWSNGMQGDSISTLSGGPYTVSVTDANACTATLSLIVNDINGTGQVTSTTPNFEILPNPNNGIFDIKLEHSDNESVQLDILNINGQLIYHTELNTPQIQLPIDLSQQPSGHYIVKATLGQQVYLKRFIIR